MMSLYEDLNNEAPMMVKKVHTTGNLNYHPVWLSGATSLDLLVVSFVR